MSSTVRASGLASEWVAVYLPVAGSIYSFAADDLISSVVGPIVSTCRQQRIVSRAFFVRYSEMGPHIRLRLLPTASACRDAVADVIKHHWAAYTSLHSDTAMAGLEWTRYEPEFDRYGGVDVICHAEELFDASSTLVFRQLATWQSEHRSARLGRATLAMLIACYVFLENREQTIAFARSYNQRYLERSTQFSERAWTASFEASQRRSDHKVADYVAYAWDVLQEGSSLTPVLDDYVSALKSYRAKVEPLTHAGAISIGGMQTTDWWSAAIAIGGRLIHMTNNRFGVSIAEEAFIAFVVEKTLLERQPS